MKGANNSEVISIFMYSKAKLIGHFRCLNLKEFKSCSVEELTLYIKYVDTKYWKYLMLLWVLHIHMDWLLLTAWFSTGEHLSITFQNQFLLQIHPYNAGMPPSLIREVR